MPSDLSSYLAERYLVPDPKSSSKKRKRKHGSDEDGSGLLIKDDDDEGWAKSNKSKHRGDEDGPVTVGNVKEARKTTKANWKTIGDAASSTLTVASKSSKDNGDDAAAAADAILASAAAEKAAAERADDDAPAVVDMMADGTHAGLQSAAAVSAQLKKRQRNELAQYEAERRAGLVPGGEAEETLYRDATGRRVDASMKRAEARRAAAQAGEKERAKKEALKGEVQVEEARRRQERLDEARTMTLARGADDEEMNQELREQQRWNDPMAQFVAVQEDRLGPKGSKRKGSRRPAYNGAAPPNRYGIRPGYRWDGVDRSNGFEQKRFAALNQRQRNKTLEYEWQMDS